MEYLWPNFVNIYPSVPAFMKYVWGIYVFVAGKTGKFKVFGSPSHTFHEMFKDFVGFLGGFLKIQKYFILFSWIFEKTRQSYETRQTPNVCRNAARFRRCLWPSHVLSAFLGFFGRFVPRHSGAGWHGKLFRLNEKSKAKVFPSRWFLSKVNMEEINQDQITNSRGRGKY